jgi:hypothetical protein
LDENININNQNNNVNKITDDEDSDSGKSQDFEFHMYTNKYKYNMINRVNNNFEYKQPSCNMNQAYIQTAEEKEFTRGKSPVNKQLVTASKNPWNILHAKNGHASFDRIKTMVIHQSVKGLKYTWDDLKHISPEPCKACYLGNSLNFQRLHP